MIKKILAITITIVLMACLLVPVLDSTNGEKTLEVYVLAGQSNAAYSNKTERCDAEYVDEHLEAPSAKLWYYGTEAMPIRNGLSSSTPSDYDTTFESYALWQMYRGGHWVIGGEEPALASTISKRTNADVLIINVGVDNQKVSELLPTATCGEYVDEVLAHALPLINRSEYPNVQYKGVVWIQGESDNVANTSVDSYIEDFMTIKDWYASKGFSQWYIVKIRPLSGRDNAATAQTQIAANNDDVQITDVARSFTIADGLMNTDGVHYTQKGRDLVGEAIGDMTPISSHFRGGLSSLLSVIPILILLSVALIGVSMVYNRSRS